MFRSRNSSTQTGICQSEMEEDEDCLSNCKRAKVVECQQEGCILYQQRWSPAKSNESTPSVFPLDQPSPLGLTLRKSDSLLDLIQTKLSEGDTESSEIVNNVNNNIGERNDVAAQPISDKTKASNFPALVLKIGTWECISRYEGHLVVKCLYAKRKFVWEVLEGGLKSKIEIHWSEILAMKTSCPDSGSSTLEIEVSRPPLFFRETSPQPRKHTQWQATSDFTNGQATISNVHCLQFAQGVFNRHYHKIMQCDPTLNLLSNKKAICEDSFSSRTVAVQDQYIDTSYWMLQDNKSYLLPEVGYVKNDYLLCFPCLSDTELTMALSLTPAQKLEQTKLEYRMVETTPHLPPFGSISDPSPMVVPKLEETEPERENQITSSLFAKGVSGLYASQCPRIFDELVTYSHLRKHVQKDESNKLADEDYDIRDMVSRFGNHVCSLFDQVTNDPTDYEHPEFWFHASTDLIGSETWARGED